MKRDILRQDDFSGGMNSRDNPKFLPSNECQVLTNAYPGRQAQARQAIQCIHGADFGSQLDPATYGANAFSYIQQFIIVENDRLPLCIARRGTDVLAFRIDSTKRNQNTYPQATGIFTSSYTPNGVTFLPIGSSQILAVGPDLVAPTIIDYSETIIDEVGPDLTEVVTNIIVRPANLSVAFVGGAPSLALLDYSGSPEVFPGGVWYRYAVTLVRRDNVTVDPLLYEDGNYVAGLVETARIADAYIQTAAGATSIDVALTVPDYDDIDDNCTHWRIYRTQGSIAGSGYVSSELEAAGLPLLWIADVPIRGTNFASLYEDTVPDDVIVAEYQYNYDGITDIPQYVDYAFTAKGRLWIAERSSLLNRGRWYVSLPPPDATNVTKHLVMFDPTGSYSLDGGETTVAGWVDTSIDDADVTRGGAMVGDDAILWNRNSMWRVRSADPSNGVEAVSLLGCHASRSITVVMDRVYWLSDQGPAMYQGGVVDKIESFKAKEVWPRNYSSPDGIGELFDGRDPDAIIAAWHNDSWHVAYNPLLRPVISVASDWGTTDTPTISAVGTDYPSAEFPYWPDEDQFVWCAYHESSNPGIRGAMNIKPSATRLLKDEVTYFFEVDLYDYIYPTPPANSLSPTAWKYGVPCGAWRELESRINTPSDAMAPEEGEQFFYVRTPWSEMVPQHFCVYNGELFYSTGANALDGYSYSTWRYNNIDSGFGLDVRDKPVMWSVWGGYLMKIPAKNQAASIEGADEHPQIFVADKVLEEGPNNWDIAFIGNCYPMIHVKSRMMPFSSKLYSYGEALDLRCGTWAHSGLFGANVSGNGAFTKLGTQYNHRTNAQVDWIFVPRLDEDNYAEDSQEGKSPYTGYDVGGISSRDFFQQVIPEGILSPHFAVEVMVPAVPYSDNTPSSVDWLEIGYIPRKNWGPTLVSLSDNQAVE